MEDSASNSFASMGSVPGKNWCAVFRYFKVTRPEGPPPTTVTRMIATVEVEVMLSMLRFTLKLNRVVNKYSKDRRVGKYSSGGEFVA